MSPHVSPTPPPWRTALPRLALRLVLIAGFVWLALQAYGWLADQLAALEGGPHKALMFGVMLTLLAAYALLIAVPFMPGIEIALALLVMQGAPIAPYVYLATVAGLYLAYLVGHLLPLDWLHDVFADLHMTRACRMIAGIKLLPPAARLDRLTQRLPGVLALPLINWRYLTVAALINLPGNIAIGGGGGILMAAGLSRLFRADLMLLTLALAVAPVPLAVWLWGAGLLT